MLELQAAASQARYRQAEQLCRDESNHAREVRQTYGAKRTEYEKAKNRYGAQCTCTFVLSSVRLVCHRPILTILLGGNARSADLS